MQSARSKCIAAAIAASTLSFAGCNAGGISPSLAPNAAPNAGVTAQAAPDAATAYAYTCQNVGTVDCLVYKNGKLYKTVKNAALKDPIGVVADKNGLLYVANGTAANVLVFTAGAKSLKQTIDNGGNSAVDVAVRNDTLAVANTHSMTYFSSGATKPTQTLKDSDEQQGRGAAIDLKGNCYWSLSTKHSGVQVDEFVGCKGKPKRLKLGGGGSPYGLAFDGDGNLWYVSFSSSANGVYQCNGVSSCKLLYSQFIQPQYLNFSSDFSDVWVSDTANYQSPAALYEIQVSNGKVLKTIYKGLSFFDPPSGVAAGPGAL